ncbi:MAG TPA: site-specific tyrosine recombinase XerC [Candidatus Acidoferrum sp.]|nr:site-specific tyrosine recombinase XerC [Candidatus Acidoferrum sp.]
MARCRAWRLDEKNSRQEHGIKPKQRLNGSPRSTLVQLLDKYLQHLDVKGFSESTLRVRRVHMEMFLKWCGRNGISAPTKVTRTSLESYQRYLFQYKKRDGQPLAVSSQHSRLAPLKVWFKWLTQRKYLPKDPAAELELPRVGYKLPNVMNKDEAERVLTQPKIEVPLGIRDRAMLEVFYSSGLRRMELLHLRLYDVDQKHGLITVREGKGKRDRVVPIGERALAWLEMYLNTLRPEIVRQPDNGVVFLTSTGAPFTPNHLSWLARQYVKSAGIGKGGACHIFRHTMATLMLEGGADIRYIQAMLGHVRLDTTQIYTHVSIRMLKQVHTSTHPGAQLCPESDGSGKLEKTTEQSAEIDDSQKLK